MLHHDIGSLRPPCKNALALSDAIIHLPKRTQVQGVARFYEHYIGSAITKKYAVYEAGDWWVLVVFDSTFLGEKNSLMSGKPNTEIAKLSPLGFTVYYNILYIG